MKATELKELKPGKPVYVICQSGLRSYIACRILAGFGFDAIISPTATVSMKRSPMNVPLSSRLWTAAWTSCGSVSSSQNAKEKIGKL